jgi:hypothetical protein
MKEGYVRPTLTKVGNVLNVTFGSNEGNTADNNNAKYWRKNP